MISRGKAGLFVRQKMTKARESTIKAVRSQSWTAGLLCIIYSTFLFLITLIESNHLPLILYSMEWSEWRF
jgi:hypothetical protein